MAKEFQDDVVEELLEKLSEGKSLRAICADKRMPSRVTVHVWAKADDELAQRIMEAREVGFYNRAEAAVEAAKTCTDPHAGRLAFDAERWFLGKLSNAFREKPIAVGAFLGVGGDDALAAVQSALDRAATTIASSGSSTQPVVIEGKARPSDPTGGLADMAGDGGPGLGEDPDRG